jgi:phosphoribosylformimino-5-aminoimidazole carboxamide ribotide isomerase
LGGGVNLTNAKSWLDAGASHVVLTSWIFQAGRVDMDRLKLLVETIGRERLVLDLSCRRRDGKYYVVTDRWQRFTELVIGPATLLDLAQFCAEFLVHAVDVEGLCSGIDEELVQNLGTWSPIPCTYAGGAKTINDLKQVTALSKGRVDLTIGSALDIFGGSGIRYEDAVAFNRNLL